MVWGGCRLQAAIRDFEDSLVSLGKRTCPVLWDCATQCCHSAGTKGCPSVGREGALCLCQHPAPPASDQLQFTLPANHPCAYLSLLQLKALLGEGSSLRILGTAES